MGFSCHYLLLLFPHLCSNICSVFKTVISDDFFGCSFHYKNVKYLFFLKCAISLCFLCSELELKPQGKLTLTVVKANDLKNMEMIGKSDPYVVVHIRPLFKVKTKVVDNNLNPVWNQTFELIVEDKETQTLILEVLIH